MQAGRQPPPVNGKAAEPVNVNFTFCHAPTALCSTPSQPNFSDYMPRQFSGSAALERTTCSLSPGGVSCTRVALLTGWKLAEGRVECFYGRAMRSSAYP